MSVNIDIRVKKADKIYHEGETVTGTLLVQAPSEIRHEGITLTMEGLVNLQLSPKNVGIFEAFYNSVKPLQLCLSVAEISGPGKLPSGKTEIPFEVPLFPKRNRSIYETYHGVFINIHYTLKCELKRGFLAKDIVKAAEFIVEYEASKCEKSVQKGVTFTITPESLGGNQVLGTVPRFKIRGKLDSTVCPISKPFTGELTIEYTEVQIKSVELQLVRVETCGCAEGYARDVTEIQNIQIGEGNVACGISVPIYMVFPRLFTCPTLLTTNFKVEFEVNVIVIFENDHQVSENFPITLRRV